jgi:hypothetical protein
MKRTASFLSMLIAMFALVSAGIAQEKQDAKKKKNVETVTCWASIDCEACKAKVEKNTRIRQRSSSKFGYIIINV